MRISLDSRIATNKAAFSSSVGDDLVLFDPQKGAYYGSGAVGERIWSLIGDGRRVTEICDALMGEFDVDRATCETEVLAFLSQLHERDLIRID